MPRTFLYRCPSTGQNVQGWSADEVTDEDDTYQSFQRVACRLKLGLTQADLGNALSVTGPGFLICAGR